MAFFIFVPAAVTYFAAEAIGVAIASVFTTTVTAATATAIGAATIGATFSALKGDKPEDILKNAVLGGITSYVGGTVGQQVSQTVSANVAQNLISSGVSQTTANAMATVLGNASSAALTSGTSAFLQGKNPVEAMLKSGLTATLSGGVGLAVDKITGSIPGFNDLSSTSSGAALSRATSSAIATSVLGGNASDAFKSSLIDSFIKTVGPDIKNALKDAGTALKDSASKVSSAQDEINNNIIRQQSIAKDYEDTISPLQKQQDAAQAAIDKYNGYKNKYDNYYTVYNTSYEEEDDLGDFKQRGFRPIWFDDEGNRAPNRSSLLSRANSAAETANGLIEKFNADYAIAKPTVDKLNDDFTSAKATYDSLKSDLDKTYQPALDAALDDFNKTEYKNTALVSEKLQAYQDASNKYKELYGKEPTAEDMGKVIKSDTTDYVKAIQDQYNTEKAAADKVAADAKAVQDAHDAQVAKDAQDAKDRQAAVDKATAEAKAASDKADADAKAAKDKEAADKAAADKAAADKAVADAKAAQEAHDAQVAQDAQDAKDRQAAIDAAKVKADKDAADAKAAAEKAAADKAAAEQAAREQKAREDANAAEKAIADKAAADKVAADAKAVQDAHDAQVAKDAQDAKDRQAEIDKQASEATTAKEKAAVQLAQEKHDAQVAKDAQDAQNRQAEIDKTAADKVATDKATSAGFPDAATYQEFGGNVDAYKASIWKPADTTMAGGEQTAAVDTGVVSDAGAGRVNTQPQTRYVPIQNVDADNKNVISASDALSAEIEKKGVPKNADISPVYVESSSEDGETFFTYYSVVTVTDENGNVTGYRMTYTPDLNQVWYTWGDPEDGSVTEPGTLKNVNVTLHKNPPIFDENLQSFVKPSKPAPIDKTEKEPINFDNTGTVLAINENGTALVQDDTTGAQSIVQAIGEPEVGSKVDLNVSAATGETTAVVKTEQPVVEPEVAPPVVIPTEVTPPVVQPPVAPPEVVPPVVEPTVITPPEVAPTVTPPIENPSVTPPVISPPVEPTVVPPVVEPVVTPPVAPAVVTPEVVSPVVQPPVAEPVAPPVVEPPIVQPPVIPPVTPPVVTLPVVTPPVTPPVVAPPVTPTTGGVTIDAVTKAINDAIAGIQFPAGITAADVAAQVKAAMAANPNLTVADVTGSITAYMTANPGLSAADVNTAITGATKDLATKKDVEAAIAGIQFPAGITSADVAQQIKAAMEANPNLKIADVTKSITDYMSANPALTAADVNTAITGATKNLATQSQLDDAVKNLSADQKTQFNNLTQAQKDEVDARVKQGQDIQNAIASSQQTTSNQVQNIQGELNGRIDALVKQGVETNAAIQQAIAESQTQINRNDANINSRIDVLVGQGVDYQKATQIAFEETRGTISDVGKQLADKIKADEADKQAASEAKRVADAAAEEDKKAAAAAALAKSIADKQAAAKASNAAQQKAAGQSGLSLLQQNPTSTSELAAAAGPLAASYLTAKEDPNKFESPLEKFLKTQNQALGKENQYGIQPQGNAMNDPSYSYGTQRPIGDILGMGSTQAGQAPDSSIPSYPTALPYAQGGGTRHGKYAQGGLSTPLMASGGKMRVDFRHGDAVTGAGDGQSDDIPAMLADGEFVFPADVVAAIGNGSTKAGSDKLYDMMHGIRAHARSAKPKDLPRQIKSPLDFLKRS